jgi:hypothetical protein
VDRLKIDKSTHACFQDHRENRAKSSFLTIYPGPGSMDEVLPVSCRNTVKCVTEILLSESDIQGSSCNAV